MNILIPFFSIKEVGIANKLFTSLTELQYYTSIYTRVPLLQITTVN